MAIYPVIILFYCLLTRSRGGASFVRLPRLFRSSTRMVLSYSFPSILLWNVYCCHTVSPGIGYAQAAHE